MTSGPGVVCGDWDRDASVELEEVKKAINRQIVELTNDCISFFS